MTVIAKPLATSDYAPAVQTTVYTAGTSTRTIIDKCTAYNGSVSAVPITVNIVPSAGTAGADNVIAVKAVSAGETYTFPEVVGHVLETGEFVSIVAGSASALVFRMSGREIT